MTVLGKGLGRSLCSPRPAELRSGWMSAVWMILVECNVKGSPAIVPRGATSASDYFLMSQDPPGAVVFGKVHSWTGQKCHVYMTSPQSRYRYLFFVFCLGFHET